MKNKLLILLLLSIEISCAYSQPIYPGSLTVLFTNENDTLVIESCNDKNNEYKTSSLQYVEGRVRTRHSVNLYKKSFYKIRK